MCLTESRNKSATNGSIPAEGAYARTASTYARTVRTTRNLALPLIMRS